MNPQLLDLLRQIIRLSPQFNQAAGGFARALPALIQSIGTFAQSVQAFVAAQGGWQAILQRLGSVGGAVARFVNAGAAGQFSPGGAFGSVISAAFGALQSFGLAAGSVGQFAARAAAAAAGGVARLGSAAAAGAGAFLASPLGVAGVAAAGVAAAFVGLGVVTERLGRTMLESQRHLAESSAAMAVVFAQSDVRRVFREMRAGNEQAGTAGFLARRLDSLADALQPLLSLLANIANIFGGIVVWIADMIVTPISLMAKAVTAIFEWLKKRFGLGDDSNDPNLLSQWLDNVAENARRDRQRNAPFRGVQFR